MKRYSSYRRNGSADAMARGLGWFSLALGAAELAAPHAIARALGMRGRERLLQAYGAREIATGIGILGSDRPRPWVWGRVAGDALDIATLSAGMGRDNPRRANVGMALGTVAAVTVLDVMCARQLGAEEEPRVVYDYSDRSGFPDVPERMRGIARDS